MYGVSVKKVKNSADFIGLNYYTHVLTSPFLPQTTEIDLPSRDHETITEFGYPMYAEGLERASKWLGKLNLPIEITENGVADKEDNLRPKHLKRHLWIIAKLIQEGVDIKSYYHWSLMDNFEWAEGYTMRFGLYHVDYETQTRTLRTSGKAYQSIIKQHQK
jgi:beta-glucosidase